MKLSLRSSSTSRAAGMTGGGVAALFLATSNAWAQPVATEQNAADVSMARELGNKGLELAQAGNCAGAIDPLARSEALHHAPTTLTILGECHIALGKLVEGAEELTRVVRENIDPQAPASFHTAQDRARVRLEATRPRIPKLRLTVRGRAPNTPLTVRFDGEPIPAASLELDRPVNPGIHRVEVSASGYQSGSGEATVQEGETRELSVQLVPLPESEASASAEAPAGGYDTMSNPLGVKHAPSYRVPEYVAFGVGAAGVAAGSVLGILTLSKASSLDKTCPTRSDCPASAQSDIDMVKATALASTLSFAVGGAGLLTGLYFLVREGASSGSSAGAHPRALRPGLHPWIGFGSGGVDGSF